MGPIGKIHDTRLPVPRGKGKGIRAETKVRHEHAGILCNLGTDAAYGEEERIRIAMRQPSIGPAHPFLHPVIRRARIYVRRVPPAKRKSPIHPAQSEERTEAIDINDLSAAGK